MSLIHRDSFDFAATPADLALNHWDIADTTQMSLSTATPFGVGQCVAFGTGSGSGQVQLSKSFGSNETTVYIGGRHIYPASFGGTSEFVAYRLYDGATVQCSISFKSNGDILFYRGDRSTLLGTYTVGWSQNTWTHFQFKVVIDGTNGEFHVRKNGATSDDYSLTTVNNKSSSNAYANKWDAYKTVASPTANLRIDDFALWSGSGSGNWSSWMGDFRAVQIMPNADTAQKQFTPATSTVTVGQALTGNTRSLSANNQYALQKIANTIPGTISKVTLNFNASMTGHIVMGIYDDTGTSGSPGALITNGTSNVVTNPATGLVDFTFSTPPSVLANKNYWVVVLADAAFTIKSDNGLWNVWLESRSYSSGLDSPMAPTANNNVPLAYVAMAITPSGNFAYVQELIEDGVVSYLQDSTAGDYDLYSNPGLATTPSAILGVSIRAFLGKSDAGARTGTVRIKSGATSVDGTTLTLSTAMQNLVMYQDTDPATSAAWTATGVANLEFGPKVVS